MPFVPVVNGVLARIVALMGGQEVINTMLFWFTSTVTQAILDSLAQNVMAWWTANFPANTANTMSVNRVETVDQTTQNGPVGLFVPSSGNLGTEVANALPANVSLCVTERTAKRGRSYRGRYYVGGMAENQSSDAFTFVPAYVAAILSAFGNIGSQIETATGSGCLHVVGSRRQNGAPLAAGIATPITAYQADPYVDSQRRRLFGRGA